MKLWIKRILGFLLIVFVIAIIIPYLIPINSHKLDSSLPFNESEYKDIHGINIHYRTWIPNSDSIKIKGKVLMVHGFGGSTFSWRNNIEDLVGKGYIVIAADLPGFGFSDKRKGIDHSQKNRSRILWDLLDQIDLSLTKEVKSLDWVLVGHSMGGGTVSAMAIDQPDKTSDLILVSGALFDNKSKPITKVLYFPPIRRGMDLFLYNYLISQEKIEDFLLSAYGRKPSSEEVQGYLQPLQVNVTPSFVADLVNASKSEPLNRLQNLDIPILYIAGEDDEIVPIQQAIDFKKIVPHTEIITIKKSAHCSMETNYDEFNNILLSFID